MRLDKLLANTGFGSRKDVKALLKKKQVEVNGEVAKDGSMHVDPEQDTVVCDGKRVEYKEYIYLMLHKPAGYLSATEDARDETVIDLLPEALQRFKPFPVGRLDKDTEGLLILTNDGELGHVLTSPRKDVPKKYFAIIKGNVGTEDIEAFQKGIILNDGYAAKPAKLHILKSGDISEIEVIVTEGKFHQVKRMFEAVDKKVLYLKRLSMGEISLDPELTKGSTRELNEMEMAYCLSLKE
ncbi:pseudouridine synthase [Aciduricibacillus chroicocephali]|uniref:Pseudouridine synthase n=1 Tax=Aciduricibacillus chroicocephali TaxID=3054939 RepID=A0ABY9KT07_9BACI|nr:pseudouridine synthase [Bacillaceae bacterium 44XB]